MLIRFLNYGFYRYFYNYKCIIMFEQFLTQIIKNSKRLKRTLILFNHYILIVENVAS